MNGHEVYVFRFHLLAVSAGDQSSLSVYDKSLQRSFPHFPTSPRVKGY